MLATLNPSPSDMWAILAGNRACPVIQADDLKTEVDIAALARVHGPKCIEVAAKLLSSEDEKMRLAACIALLDRGFGRPKQELDVNGTSTIELHLVAAKMVSQQLLDGTIEAEITEPDIEVSSISPEAEAEQPTE